ncbi:lysine 2,3-aminomutase [bacterium CG_4_9_14_3_um_filter_65_15]|nr:MAG: lysine 2,3-aminomutase [bacterium CG_4_9_14_3_um_filter_65_15]
MRKTFKATMMAAPLVRHRRKENESVQTDEPPSGLADHCQDPFEADIPVPAFFLARRLPPTTPKTRAFRRRFYPQVSDAEWSDWRWQMRNRISSAERFAEMLQLTLPEQVALSRGGGMLPVGITPYYCSLLDSEDPHQPLRRTVVPDQSEFLRSPGEADDPLDEDADSPVPGIVHRYPDRVLFLVHDTCATYCRYCTRSRVVGHGEILPSKDKLEVGLDYIRRNPQIRDVLISGGDPLTLSDGKLDWLLGELRGIPHVQFLRIGTKVPVVMPQRIDRALVRILKKYHPLWMSIHFTHPDECTPEVVRACRMLADAGIPLGSQTVLLKGVNDNIPTMRALVHRELMMRVRPYYLYQCDPISGSAHFRTGVDRGLEIISGLRGWTTGYGVPTFVIDAPGGGGKIPLQPDSYVGENDEGLLLRSYKGTVHCYPDPSRARGSK